MIRTWAVGDLVVQALRQIALVSPTFYPADRHWHRFAAEEVAACRVRRITEAQLSANHAGLEDGPAVGANDAPI